MKINAISLSIIVLLAGCGLCMAETTITKMPATQAPILFQITGSGDAALAPTRYPKFIKKSSTNPTCDDYLVTDFKESVKGVARPGLSFAPLWLKSAYGNGTTNLSAEPGYTLIPGLQVLDFTLPKQHKSISKLLITWTVRIEGSDPAAWQVYPKLCKSWYGTCYEEFLGGQVHTRLYVNGKAIGPVASMSVPDGGTAKYTRPKPPPPPPPPQDPTLSGSCLLSKEDFGGAFPDKMNIEIRWYNDTSLDIKSPTNMRNLNITVMPVVIRQE